MVCLSRPYPFKYFKSCHPQILFKPFLNTLPHLKSRRLKFPMEIFQFPISQFQNFMKNISNVMRLQKRSGGKKMGREVNYVGT